MKTCNTIKFPGLDEPYRIPAGTVKSVNGIAPDAAGNVELPITAGGTISCGVPKFKSVNHRGYNTVAPENTIPAFILSKQKGFDYVECDVRFTSDGVPVLIHNETIDNTSNGSGSIALMTYEQVLQYDFGRWKSAEYAGTRIATFAEFIRLCRDLGLHPYIELKGGMTEDQIASLLYIVAQHSMTRNVTWISFVYTNLGYVANYDNSARLGCLMHTVTADALTQAQGLRNGINQVYVSAGEYTADAVAMVKAAGLPMEVFTINNAQTVVGLDPYITGVTSDSLIASDALKEAAMVYEYTEVPGDYTVAYNLTNVISSNAAETADDGQPFSTTIKPRDGSVIDTVAVVMGGTDVTNSVYADGVVTIPAVSGNVVITAAAVMEKKGALLHSFDLTTDGMDSVGSGWIQRLNKNSGDAIPEITESGLALGGNQYAVAKDIAALKDVIIELDIAAMTLPTSASEGGGRFFGISEATQGILYKSVSLGWGIYADTEWTYASQDKHLNFAGKTMQCVLDSDGVLTVYINGVYFMSNPNAIAMSPDHPWLWMCWANSTYTGQTATFTALRVYQRM